MYKSAYRFSSKKINEVPSWSMVIKGIGRDEGTFYAPAKK